MSSGLKPPGFSSRRPEVHYSQLPSPSDLELQPASNGRSNVAPTSSLPKVTKPTSRKRRAWCQVGATVLMSFTALLPLLLYSLAAYFSPIAPNSGTPAGVCSNSSSYSFFEPDLVMGNFTLGEAKLIDVAWDTVIGKGLQILMGLGSYRIVMQGLTRLAESTPVSYSLFLSVVLQPSSISTAVPLCSSLFRLGGWRSKFAMAWLLYSLGVLAAIPVLMDASSGYVRLDGLMYFPPGNGSSIFYQPSDTLPNAMWEAFQVGNFESNLYQCTPSASYQWGFVSGWILVTIPIYSIWVFGTYVMWMDAQHNSPLTRKGRKLGEWTAVVDLAAALRRELGPEAELLSPSELAKALKSRPPVRYEVQDGEDGIQRARLVPQDGST